MLAESLLNPIKLKEMGYMKKLAIKQEEQKLAELYENNSIEKIILEAQRQLHIDNLMYEELLLDEQIKKDKEANQNG